MSTASLVRPSAAGRTTTAVSLVLIATPHLPAVAFHYAWMWDNANYSAFPLVWLGACVLAVRDSRNLGTLAAGGRRTTSLLLAGCWLLMAAAVVLMSPWLACASGHVTLLALAYWGGGGRFVRAVLPAWAFLWLSLPRPWLDGALTDALRSLAGRWSSSVLDALGVFHIPEGRTITVVGARLLIGDACSGIHSLFVVLSAVIFFVFYRRLTVPRSLALLAAATFWVLAANTARIVFVGWSAVRWGLDLSTGWRHEALGLATAGLTLGLVASTDCLFDALGGSVFRSVGSSIRERRRRRSKAWHYWQNLKYVPTPAVPRAEPPPPSATRWPDPSGETRLGPRVGLAYAVLAAAMLAWLWPCFQQIAGDESGGSQMIRALGTLDGSTRASIAGPDRPATFETVRRGRDDNYGEFSRVWAHDLPPHRAAASVDYPFTGWHDVTYCYMNAGWTVVSREAHDGTGGLWIEAELQKSTGQVATVFFSLLDGYGRPVAPDLAQAGLFNRLAVWRASTRADLRSRLKLRRSTFQVQLLVTGGRPLTDAERFKARDEFLGLRQICVARVKRSGPEAS